MRCLATLSALVCLAVTSTADEPKDAAGYLKRGIERQGKRKFDEAIRDFTECLKLDPKNLEALDRRGSTYFFAGKFNESVADFDAQIKLDPKLADGHWRRGISLYYAGKYEEGKKQFNAYERTDTNDVENAVWHFMCAAKKDGWKKAQAGVLKIGKDGRTPMMQVYDLFKGKLKPEGVMAAAKEGKFTDDQRTSRFFYANLYLGIYYDLTGERKKAIEHLAESLKYRKTHFYMGEVARVHHELLKKQEKK